MILNVDTENKLESIVSSYETRIQSVETLFETTYQLLQGLQDSVLDTREERGKIHNQLKESLAKNESLRKKDFDSMISVISSHQDKQEQEVRNLSKSYLNEQTNLIHELRENLRNFKEALAKGESQRVKEFETMIKEILVKQEKRKQEVISRLKEFQTEQQETAKMLRDLLAKGRKLRIKDLKLMLDGFIRARQDRIVRQEERRREVKQLLDEFKSERAKTVRKRPVTCKKTPVE
jgi:hypothetical protein